MIYANPTRGQEILNKKIDLVAQQQEVKAILNQISKSAGVKFVYSAEKVPAHKKVSLSAYNQRLAEILDRLLAPLDIFYHVSGDQVVLMRRGDDDNTYYLFSPETEKKTMDETSDAKLISGKVTNENGDPLAGVSVLVKGTARGTSTDGNGSFSISVDEGETLEFSMVGYKIFSIRVGNQKTLTVQMQASNSSMNEIIVVGYGTQKRSTLTGAVASVSSKTLNELPVASIDQALQGRVSGLSVTNNGSPGTAPIVAIRGISSINYATDPLYVIDGFPTGNLTNFDAKDVEAVEVLKDASAAAIYGSRATNGVIIITTKKGKRDSHLQISLDSYVGMQSPAKKISLLNTKQYLQYERAIDGAAGIGVPPALTDANMALPIYQGATQTFAQTNTDWQDAYFVRNALITQHNLSVSGGNNSSRFYISGGYFKQDGIAQALTYERGNFRINSEHTINKVITFGENLYSSFGNQHYEGTGGNRSPLTNVIRMQPYLPVRDPTKQGGFRGPQNSYDGADPTNPVEAALIGYNSLKTLKILGTAYLDINLTSWLKFRSTFGVDYSNSFGGQIDAGKAQYTPIYNDGGTLSATSASINNERKTYTTLLYTQQLTFDKTFDKHHITATGVFERQGQRYNDEQVSGNQSTNNVQTLNGATNISANTRFEENLIISYVGRLTYDYAGKYLLSASLRRDGLSVWAPGHKWENFPSASVGWKIDQESFMSSVKDVSELKLRAGYGITGLNVAVGPTGANGVVVGNYPWEVGVQSNQALYPFGGTLTNGSASYYNQLGNLDIAWETTKQLNFGLDLGLFNNTVTLTAEYFKRKTDNLILNVPTPGSFGFGGVGVNGNVASMQNKGLELQLGYHQREGAFRWDLTGLVSVIRNKVLSLNTPTASIVAGGDADFGGGSPITKTVAGRPVQSFYGWQTDGIFQSATDVSKGPVQLPGTNPAKSTAPGDIRFKDLNGDGKITDADETFIGSYLPKFTYSLNYSASYMNFDLGVFFQGVQGNKVFNAERIIAEGMVRLFNSGTAVLNAWTPTNTNTDIPRAISADPNQNARPSNRWLEDGSYLRLKNLMLGYTLPAGSLHSLTKGAVTRFRIYISSQNLFTVAKYKGWDPEVGTRRTTLTNGIDYGQYPSARSYQVGVQVGF
ncbi:MAG TPA: TonB-dependent receptor [Puia sp.]|nr:TonB-dependent receptor [Puia sp.]